MKTNVRDTSIDAFRGVKVNAGQAKVLGFMLHYPARDWTRNELATMAGIPINAICPRVLELIEAGLVEEMPRRACRFTGKQAHPVRVVPTQRSLFEAA